MTKPHQSSGQVQLRHLEKQGEFKTCGTLFIVAAAIRSPLIRLESKFVILGCRSYRSSLKKNIKHEVAEVILQGTVVCNFSKITSFSKDAETEIGKHLNFI